jgi:radical SAM superfamily enzyme YgiQ (UPF0313 family)
MSSLQLITDSSGPRMGVVPRGAPAPRGISRLEVLLVKPSKYDDDGYVMRYVRGVLPSNTLATLAALTSESVERGELGSVDVRIRMMDELVQKIDPERLARRYRRQGTRTIVALCGVQTNQFPRAADLARQFHAAGLPVMVGGFHVSGAIAMSPTGIPPECQALIDEGITLVKGEVEECWGDLLRDALHGRLKTYYDIHDAPDLSKAPIPVVDPRLMKRFAYPYMGTIDAGRGCPFNCHFCTIINVQGRKMRNRSAEQIKDRIRRNAAMKIDYYFFTDDNFSRNPEWEAIFDALISLKRDEGIDVQFMMQIDTVSYKTPNFVSKAAEAGCSQVFIGMETVNPDNIAASGKRQNKVQDYRTMIDAWHARGIACHVGYIIGFPADSVESVRENVRTLREDVQVDQASFFMLMPIPGSQDHLDMVLRNEWMDDDYNNFDSFHPTTHHPKMSHDEWFEAYRQAWRDFYSLDSMKTILGRANDVTYWGLFKNFIWYKYSTVVDGTHPMITGFFRLKSRTQRRPGFAVESRWAHGRRRTREIAAWIRGVAAVYFEMQEVWLATRGRAQIKNEIDGLKRRYESARAGAGEMIGRVGAAPGRAFRRASRADLNAYWRQTRERLRRGHVFRVNPFTLTVNAIRDAWLCLRFNASFLQGYGK